MFNLAKAIPISLALLLTMALVGCGPKSPFALASVEGKITYADGSLIEADQIVVRFFPQGIPIQGKKAPRVGETRADVTDGSFSDFTTWKYGDGVMVGTHKVVAISLRATSYGGEEPSDEIPQQYHDPKTTPLEVEVTGSGDSSLLLKVQKGRMK